MNYNIRKFENFHILLWLIKDLCWVTLYRTLGMVMILPTLALAIYITFKNRQDHSELAHNLAICFWIAANSTWMVGEFFFNDSTRSFSVIFFLLGLLMMARYYFSAVYKMAKRKNK